VNSSSSKSGRADCSIWLCHLSFSPAFRIPESTDLNIFPTRLCFPAVPESTLSSQSPVSKPHRRALLQLQFSWVLCSQYFERNYFTFLDFLNFLYFSVLMQERQACSAPGVNKLPLLWLAASCGELKTYSEFLLEDTQNKQQYVTRKGTFLVTVLSCLLINTVLLDGCFCPRRN